MRWKVVITEKLATLQNQKEALQTMVLRYMKLRKKQKKEVLAKLSDSLKSKVSNIYRVIPLEQKKRLILT